MPTPEWVHAKPHGQCRAETFASHTTAPAQHFPFAEHHPHPLWVASPAAPTPAAPAAMPTPNPWLTTEQLCAELAIPETADAYVLLHHDTGTALYATSATEAEIHRANANLRQSVNRNRYVAARHLPHQRGDGQG